MSTSALTWLHRGHRPHGLILWLAVGLAVVAGSTVAVGRTFFSPGTHTCVVVTTSARRPKLQHILDDVVAGPSKLAPGATAYVLGPRGSWSGAAGVADTSTCAPMRPDARMRLESVSKIYTATLILQLAQAGKLHVSDTVARWLPGLLPYGHRITIRQLLTMSSGLIDNNDFNNASESDRRASLANVKDARLRARLETIASLADKNPATEISPTWWVRWAAWQPLQFTPGTAYRYSNIGYDILGLIATRAGGQPLATLYSRQIFRPLGLHTATYDPQGPIDGPHASGYGIPPGARQIDTTDWHWGVGAEGGIVSDARDTATFLTALMRGKLLDAGQLTAMRYDNLWQGGETTPCAGQAYGWSGGGSGYKTEVWVDDVGSRVTVLLLNARHYDTAQPAADQAAHDTLARLYCRA